MHVVELHAENFRRLRVVEIRPTGDAVVVTGRNEQGKSSVLDFIAWVIAGPKSGVEAPLRIGTERGGGHVDLGDLKVERFVSVEGKPTLRVTKPGGSPRGESSPQGILDKIYGALTFDPLAFGAMKPSDRAATLRQLVGIDTEELDYRRKHVYDERTVANASVKSLEARVAALKLPTEPEAAGEMKDIRPLADAKANIVRANAANAAVRQQRQTAFEKMKAWEAKVAQLEEELSRCKRSCADATAAHDSLTAQFAALMDVDVASADAAIDACDKHNAEVRERQKAVDAYTRATAERKRLYDERSAASKAADALTAQIAEIDAEKTQLLEAAEWPYPGMTVDGDEVFVGGVPYGALSQSQHIKVGVAMGRALSKGLDICLVKSGDHLDEDSERELIAECAAAGTQVWIERVQRGAPCGVVIEDGEVREIVNHKPVDTSTQSMTKAMQTDEIF